MKCTSCAKGDDTPLNMQSENKKQLHSTITTDNALASQNDTKQKQAEIRKAMNYEYTEKDVDPILSEKVRFKQKLYNFAAKKVCNMKARDSANSRMDENTAQKMNVRIQVRFFLLIMRFYTADNCFWTHANTRDVTPI